MGQFQPFAGFPEDYEVIMTYSFLNYHNPLGPFT